MKRGALLSVLVIMLISCLSEKPELTEQNPNIRQALEKRKQQYISSVMETCRTDVYQKAAEYVDSLIAAEISFQLSDSIVFPPRPIYPGWPGPILLQDSFHVSPLLQEE
jgi:hypothetical protein